MNKKNVLYILYLALIIVALPSFAYAEKYIINIKGEVRTPDGNIDRIYQAGLATDKGSIESESIIDYDKGIFEIKNAVLDTDADFNYVAVHINGSCFSHSYRIMRRNDRFEVSDGSGSDQDLIITTTNPNIDLGTLIEYRPNIVMVDFDVPVRFLAEDTSGNWVGENGNYMKITGNGPSFKTNSNYILTLTKEDNEKIVRKITTGDQCVSTRLIKRGSYFVEEHLPNNSLPKIGFFRNIWLSILGLKMTVIIPLIAILLIVVTPIILKLKR